MNIALERELRPETQFLLFCCGVLVAFVEKSDGRVRAGLRTTSLAEKQLFDRHVGNGSEPFVLTVFGKPNPVGFSDKPRVA